MATVGIAALGAVLLGTLVPGSAEEVLVKGDARYLGWKVADAKFKTCQSKELTIANGLIQKTSDKCGSGPGPGPFTATADVLEVDEGASTITIGKDGKRGTKFFFPSDAQEKSGLSIGTLKGAHVKITGPVNGRASFVAILAGG